MGVLALSPDTRLRAARCCGAHLPSIDRLPWRGPLCGTGLLAAGTVANAISDSLVPQVCAVTRQELTGSAQRDLRCQTALTRAALCVSVWPLSVIFYHVFARCSRSGSQDLGWPVKCSCPARCRRPALPPPGVGRRRRRRRQPTLGHARRWSRRWHRQGLALGDGQVRAAAAGGGGGGSSSSATAAAVRAAAAASSSGASSSSSASSSGGGGASGAQRRRRLRLRCVALSCSYSCSSCCSSCCLCCSSPAVRLFADVSPSSCLGCLSSSRSGAAGDDAAASG